MVCIFRLGWFAFSAWGGLHLPLKCLASSAWIVFIFRLHHSISMIFLWLCVIFPKLGATPCMEFSELRDFDSRWPYPDRILHIHLALRRIEPELALSPATKRCPRCPTLWFCRPGKCPKIGKARFYLCLAS